MDELIQKMIEKGLISIVKGLINKQEIANYTKLFKADNYTDWIRLNQRN